VDFIGMPEGDTALAQAVTYLATAPKSNAVYLAYGRAKEDVASRATPPVPLHIRNAPTKLMKEQGFGEGYRYPHDYTNGLVEQDYMPEELKHRVYYEPTNRGYEARIKSRLDRWRKILAQRRENQQ
jgi:putative ATPase